MRTLLILLISIASFGFVLPKRHFNRLNKLYQKDQDKCLKVCQRIANWDSKSSAIYYFSTLIYTNKIPSQSTLRKKYAMIGKAINAARKLNKLDGDLASSDDWRNNTNKLDSLTSVLYKDLVDDGNIELAQSLDRKRAKMDFRTLTEGEKESVVHVEIKKEPEAPKNFVHVKGEYYGMPTGQEMIVSYSIDNEKEMLRLINEERKKLGMEPLELVEDLCRAARYHSCDMATQNYFNHSSYDRINNKLYKVGKTFDRIRKFYNSTFVNSENIAAGNEKASSTYMQWYNSPGHYQNMFNKESRKCGIGVFYDPNSTFKYYWTFCGAK